MIAATTYVFSHGHIALTAAITGVIAAGIACWRLNHRGRWIAGLMVRAAATIVAFAVNVITI
jgi:hypothetical protein